jgi:hypothetical protein
MQQTCVQGSRAYQNPEYDALHNDAPLQRSSMVLVPCEISSQLSSIGRINDNSGAIEFSSYHRALPRYQAMETGDVRR